MKSQVIFVAILVVLAVVQAKPFLPGLDVVEKAVGSAAGGVVGGATGAVKGGVEGIKNGVKNGIGGVTDDLFGKEGPLDFFDI